MKPAARLHLIKQREYRKQCAEGRHRPDQRPGAMNPSWNNPDAGKVWVANVGFGSSSGYNLRVITLGFSGNRVFKILLKYLQD